MLECKICNKMFKNLNSLGKHLHHSHTEITPEEYYNTYIGKVSSVCVCGNKKKFRSLGEGYRKYCSTKCRSNNIQPTKYWSGKKQSKEMIKRRISNTNQTLKESVKAKNNLVKYGFSNIAQIPEIRKAVSLALKGRKCPRKDGQQQKIINAKIRNGTNKHKAETKEKIRNSLNKIYSSDNPPVTLSENNHKNHVTGYYNGLFYRSSYELRFMKYCDENGIKFISAENKTYRCPYEDNKGKRRWYYPDYYLPEYNIVIEIKPASMLTIENVQRKINAGKAYHNLIVVDETILDNLDKLFEELNS